MVRRNDLGVHGFSCGPNSSNLRAMHAGPSAMVAQQTGSLLRHPAAVGPASAARICRKNLAQANPNATMITAAISSVGILPA